MCTWYFTPPLHLYQRTILVGSLLNLLLLQPCEPDSCFFFTVHLYPHWYRVNEQADHTLNSRQFWRSSRYHHTKDHICLPTVACKYQCPGRLYQCTHGHVLSARIPLTVCRCRSINLQYLFCIYAGCLNFSLSAIHSQWCWGDYSGQDLPPVQLGGLVFLLGKPTDVVTIRARLCVC